ncbi:MAG: hypothetical protein LBK13_13015 [Spirochaetales bacterium]|jgi:hypothetical protein|nr:hypothetical protein [Spirochaetales bacterium]
MKLSFRGLSGFTVIFLRQNLGALLALPRQNRAFRSKSSEAPMRFLWAFRYNPLRRTAAAQNCFAILPSARTHGRAAKLRTQFCDQPLLRAQAFFCHSKLFSVTVILYFFGFAVIFLR